MKPSDVGGSIFVYKLTTDNGGAPCIHAGILSLAICKPRIRVRAQEGDWIIGFGGKSVPELNGRLIYIAKVTSIVEGGDYYAGEEYRRRPDCIYQYDGSQYQWRPKSKFHLGGEQLEHDLGKPDRYKRAKILLSHNFVYCGGTLNPSIAAVEKIICNALPRDYRANHAPEIRECLAEFIASVMDEYSGQPPGQPTQSDTGRICNKSADDDDGVMECT